MMGAVLPRDQVPAQRRDDLSSARSEWRENRLREARGVLADLANYPVSLVLLASRVVEAHTEDRVERIRAHALANLLQSEREGRL